MESCSCRLSMVIFGDHFVLPKIKNQKFMFHSSGQIKAFMTSKHNTFENNVMFHFDRKTVLQYEKKKVYLHVQKEKGSN